MWLYTICDLFLAVAKIQLLGIRDEKSEKMLQLWNVVDETNYEGELIGIRIYDGSDAAHQFAQICMFQFLKYFTSKVYFNVMSVFKAI